MTKLSFEYERSNAVFTSVQVIAVLVIILARCSLTDECNDVKKTSLSNLLDYKALSYIACAFITLISTVQIFVGLKVYYKDETGLLATLFRIFHTITFVSAIGIGIARLGAQVDVHMAFAYVLFVSLGIEQAIMLAHRYTAEQSKNRLEQYPRLFLLQILHLGAYVGFIIAFEFTGNGWYEVASVCLGLMYFNWASLHHIGHLYEVNLTETLGTEASAISIQSSLEFKRLKITHGAIAGTAPH